MKLAIVGTRECSAYPIVEKAVTRFLLAMHEKVKPDTKIIDLVVTEIVSGGARGIDRLAEMYAEKNGLPPAKVFEPKKPRDQSWVDQVMKARNQEIVNYADAMVAIRLPDQSPGTDDAIERMKNAGKPVAVFDLRPVFVELSNGNS